MATAAIGAPATAGPSSRASRTLLPGVLAQSLTFGPLAAFGALHWAGMLQPAEPLRGLICVAVALAAVPALRRLHSTTGRRRAAALTGCAAVAVAVALLAAGVPARLLLPQHWGTLASGVWQGATTLPGVTIPYRGADDWARWSLEAGGGLLVLLAAVATFAGRSPGGGGRRLVAGAMLATLYAVPVIENNPHHPALSGAIFALLAAAFVWLDRVERRHAGLALAGVLVTTAMGLAAGPRLDADRPWLDYEALAQDLTPTSATHFSWDHGYGPLDWPRDGREILRVKADRSAYWKAVSLQDFDGVRWRQARTRSSQTTDTEFAPRRPGWHQDIRVSVRNVTTKEFVAAGTTEELADSPRNFVRTAPGQFATFRRPLRKGQSYRARVYVPRPSAGELAAAGSQYPGFAVSTLTMELPPAVGGPPPLSVLNPPDQPSTQLLFSPWGSGGSALLLQPGGTLRHDGSEVLQRSRYRRSYALARQLVAQSSDPYDFVRRVQRRVREGARYTEDPVRSSLPLETFLFDRREGYCQQFSGAMALLLRMGGVPARVASGFAPGSLDRARREFVVRDIDAHSWVEAYFPRLGWVTFDPTPAIAPPRAQRTDEGGAGRSGDSGDLVAGGDRPTAGAGARAHAGGAGAGWLGWRGGVAALALVLTGTAAWRALARRGRPTDLAADPALRELQTALHRARRPPSGVTTLAALEEGLVAWPGALAYVRAVRLARFGGRPVRPSPVERADLRRALAAGGGASGRLRAWWALPPRFPVGQRRTPV